MHKAPDLLELTIENDLAQLSFASTTLRAVKSPLEHLSPGPLPPA